jgi:RNA polymerase sigma-70 factor (ECF subfamily)
MRVVTDAAGRVVERELADERREMPSTRLGLGGGKFLAIPNHRPPGGIWTPDRSDQPAISRPSERYDRQAEGDADAVTRAANGAMSVDDALVRRASTGDATAFEVLVDSRIDRCYRLAWSILSNEADAADATQDALVSAWRQLPRLRDPATFDGWLNRIVANAALKARRHRVRLREVSVRPAYPGDETPQPEPVQDPLARTAMDEFVDNDAIARAFDRLRPQDRVILAHLSKSAGCPRTAKRVSQDVPPRSLPRRSFSVAPSTPGSDRYPQSVVHSDPCGFRQPSSIAGPTALPRSGPASTSRTVRPRSARRRARTHPAEPPPTMRTSTASGAHPGPPAGVAPAER